MSADGQPIGARRPPVIADHELLLRIGEGAYGEVWLARNVTGAYRAVKVIYRYRFADDRPYNREFKGITRFEPISRTNEGLVDILQVGRDENMQCFYYVMELADNASKPGTDQSLTSAATDAYNPKTLQSELRRGRLPFEECLQLGLSLTLALAHLHRHGLIHRDIKPSNIIFVGGVPKLADIGLVTGLAEARSYVGTEGFIPPEGPNSRKADIFSLGKVLYEASMGKDRQDFPEPCSALVDDSEAPALLELNAVILKACASDPRERYQSAEELHFDLALLHSGRSVKRRHLLERRLAQVSRAGLVAAGLALLAGAGWLIQRHQTDEIRRIAGEEARQRSRAETALAKADEHLVRLELQRAEEYFATDRSSLALAHLARVMREHPQNRVPAERLASALALRDFILPVCPPITVESPVTDARFSPDGQCLVITSTDGQVRLCDAFTGRLLAKPWRHDSEVRLARFTTDGQELLTVAADGVVRFWTPPSAVKNVSIADASLPSPLHEAGVGIEKTSPSPARILKLPSLEGRLMLAELSRDARRLVGVTETQTLYAWEVGAAGSSGGPLPLPETVTWLRSSPDAERVLVAKTPDTAQVWDTRTARPLTPLLTHRQRILSADFSPGGDFVVTTAVDGLAKIWNVQTGQQQGRSLSHDGWVLSARFSADGQRIVTASADRTARIWETRTGESAGAACPHDHQVMFVEFAPEGRRMLTVTVHNVFRLWDTTNSQPLSEPLTFPAKVISFRFSPDGDRLLVGGDDRSVRLFDLRMRPMPATTVRHEYFVTSAIFSPDGDRLLTASKDKTARLWNAHTGQPEGPPLRHAGIVTSAEFSRDGSHVVTASHDGTARLWDTRTSRSLGRPLAHGAPLNHAGFDPSGRCVVTTSRDGMARVWNAHTLELIGAPLRHDADVIYAEFSPDGKRVATASRDHTARVWDFENGCRLVATLRHADEVHEAHFSPDGTRVVTASRDQTARVWDAKTGQAVSPALRHAANVGSADFSPDGLRVVTASDDNTARIWSARTGQPLTESLHHAAAVETARFSPDGGRVITASRDGTARVWDAATGWPLSEPLRHDSRVYAARFSPDGLRLATAGRDHTARIWDTPLSPASVAGWLPQLAEAVGGQFLNEQRVVASVNEKTFWNVREQLLATNGPAHGLRWVSGLVAERFPPSPRR